jgi:hypothetical protein
MIKDDEERKEGKQRGNLDERKEGKQRGNSDEKKDEFPHSPHPLDPTT